MNEAPLLFLKTGAPGAEPLYFYEALAQHFEATHLSYDKINLALGEGVLAATSTQRRKVRRNINGRAQAALRSGESVVYDRLLNQYDQRRSIYDTVAHPLGALPLVLCMKAPIDVIATRLRDRYSKDALPFPRHLVKDADSLIGSATRRLSRLEQPMDTEPHLILDGQRDVSELIAQVVERVVDLRAAAG